MSQPQDHQPVPPNFGKIVNSIGLAAGILGLFCLYDALREGLGAYQYHSAIPLLAIYNGVLGIYAAARQGHQWQDPDADASRGGHYFVFAWLALPVFLNALELGRLWNPPPIQPADLNNTINWVVGFYVFGKVSALARVNGLRPFGLGKALDARLAARRAAVPLRPAENGLASGDGGPLPAEKRKIMEVLGLGIEVLGGFCLFDVLREAITPPYQSSIDIHYAYKVVLAAYAGANQWRKWAEPEGDSRRYGPVWLGLWLGALLLIKGLESISAENIIVMPRHLMGTLVYVFSIYGLGVGSDWVRTSRRRAGGGEAQLPKPAEPVSPPAGEAGQDPGAGSQPPEDESGHLEAVAAACEQAGDFAPSDIVSSAGMSISAVRHWLGVLVRMGWVEKTRYGRYRWIGRGGDA